MELTRDLDSADHVGSAMGSAVRRSLFLLALAALVVFAVGILLIALVAALPQAVDFGDGFLGGFTAPNSWWGPTIVAFAAAVFWVTMRALRPIVKRRPLTTPLIGLALTTVVLGLSAYLPCSGGQAPVWAPLSWTIALFVGSVENPFGSITGCSGEMPLALQLARLTAMMVLYLGVAGLVGVLLRDTLDRTRTRRARSVVFVVGVDESTIGVLRRVRWRTPRRTLVAVLIDEGKPQSTRDAVRDAARALNCTALLLDPTESDMLLLLARAGRRGRFGLDSAYLIDSDAATNLRTLRALQRVEKSVGSGPRKPRAIVKIDDPWQAEYWRRLAVCSPGGWILDTTSAVENTARIVVQAVLDRGTDGIVLVGDSPLALAILVEFAQRQRELDASRFVTVTVMPRVWVAGDFASELVDQHELRQRRFGNRRTTFVPQIMHDPPTWQALRSALQEFSAPAVVITDPAFSERFASSLAARNPNWPIFAYDTSANGLPSEAVMEKLFTFGPVLELPDGTAIDSWERVARIAHSNYLHDLVAWGESADRPSAQPWESLSPFYRESNLRLITTTLSSAGAIGRSWVAEVPESVGERAVQFTAEEVRKMSRFEHESWLAHHRENGWTWNEARDDRRKQHHWLLPWERLPQVAVDRTEGTVRDALELLGALGYHANPTSMPAPRPSDDNNEWVSVRRKGSVNAIRLTEPYSWQGPNGDEMAAVAGDWRLDDTCGDTWSIADREFRESYEHIEADTWRRTGEVLARPGVSGETLQTLEGPGTVAEGDWVVMGRRGVVWSVSAEHFALNYELLS